MRNSLISCLALGAVLAGSAVSAFAADDCKGMVKVDTIYGGGSPLEYRAQVRNETGKTMTAQLTFVGFPNDVKVTRPVVSVTLAPNASERVLFGKGTNQGINSGTVDFVYGRADAPAKPMYVRVTACAVR